MLGVDLLQLVALSIVVIAIVAVIAIVIGVIVRIAVIVAAIATDEGRSKESSVTMVTIAVPVSVARKTATTHRIATDSVAIDGRAAEGVSAHHRAAIGRRKALDSAASEAACGETTATKPAAAKAAAVETSTAVKSATPAATVSTATRRCAVSRERCCHSKHGSTDHPFPEHDFHSTPHNPVGM